MLDPERRGIARAHPDEPTRLERHGTQLAGLIVGRGGPGGIHGVAPAATILPIRVAGWQPSAEGGFAVYGRTDQLLAGIERAVDPDADGDVLDAARVAVVGVTEPFASFADGPIARAVAGRCAARHARRRARRERGAGRPELRQHRRPGRRARRAHGRRGRPPQRHGRRSESSSGPGCTCCSTGRSRSPAPPRRAAPLTLTVARPRRDAAAGPRGTPLARYFDDHGYSLVAGRATLLSRASGPTDEARSAVLAGAAAILVDGLVPAGALGLDDRLDVPVSGSRRRPRPRSAPHSPAGTRSTSRSVRPAGGRTRAAPRSRRSPRTASRSAAGSSRRSPHRVSSSSPPTRAGTPIAPPATRRSAARARRRRSRAALPPCSHRPARSSTRAALKGALVGTARPAPRARPPPRAPARSTRWPPPRPRWSRSPRPSASARPTRRAGAPSAGSRCGTSPRAASRSTSPPRPRRSPASRSPRRRPASGSSPARARP